jgi:hypothetical protein
MPKTIDDVRRELERWKEKWRAEAKRADAAVKEALVQKSRAEAYQAALMAVIADMKRLGLRVEPVASGPVTPKVSPDPKPHDDCG